MNEIKDRLTDLENLVWGYQERIEQLEKAANPGFDFSSKQVAELAGVSTSRIRQLFPKLQEQGLGKKIGRDYFFKNETIEFIKGDKENANNRDN